MLDDQRRNGSARRLFAADLGGSPAPVVKAADLSARREAHGIVASARAEAEALVEAAKAQASDIVSAAQRQSADQMKSDAARAAAEHAARLEADLGDVDDALRQIVLDCVRKIVAWMPPEDRLAALCARALRDLSADRRLQLFVAPSQTTHATSSLARDSRLSGIEVIARDGLDEDEALLETPYGVLDLSVESQLDAIADGLKAARARRAG